MADIQLNSVTLATESGGTVTLDNGVQDNITRLGTVATGNINALYGSGKSIEYSRGAYGDSGGIDLVNTTTPWNPGMEAKLNPASGTDLCIINYMWSWYDETAATAQRHFLYVDGSEHLKWTNHMNHFNAAGKYSNSSLCAVRTASDFGWSSGTLIFSVRVACQQESSNTWTYNSDIGGNAEDGYGYQMTMIQAWRYPTELVTAGTNAS